MGRRRQPSPAAVVIPCLHPDYPGATHDLTELVNGLSESQTGGRLWRGAFKGRPKLVAEIMEAIQIVMGAYKPSAFKSNRSGFRNFWRFLDRAEEDGLGNVSTLEDIGLAHGVAWVRSEFTPHPTAYSVVRSVLETAKELNGQSALGWMSLAHRRNGGGGDVATAEQARLVYAGLKRRVYAIYDRWAAADKAASEGRNLAELTNEHPIQNPTNPDLHATYRALVESSGTPIPSSTDMAVALGYGRLRSTGSARKVTDVVGVTIGIRDLVEGMYPSQRDLQDMYHLALIQVGWNPQVLLDVDISSDNWATQIGDPTADIYRLSSIKVRSGEWQTTVSRGKPSQAPFQIVNRLISRTKPLRDGVLQKKASCVSPIVAARSPWLFPNYMDAQSVGILNELSYRTRSFLPALADEINLFEAARYKGPEGEGPPTVPRNMKTSDFRDIYIGNEFLQSGYNLVIAKLAAGHTTMATIKRYLNTRAWRRHSEGSVRKLMDHLWGELETHRVCDPVILRALVEKGEVSEEQRQRWLAGKDRTYLGMGCTNPYKPPRYVDPESDGKSICRKQHRCTICERGIVMQDSLSFLAMRRAELEAIQRRMSMTAWLKAAEYQVEQDKLLATLAQFDPVANERATEHWRREIKEGRHSPLEWEGEHDIG